mmetsp:Transcript_11967/g.28641  ORF Transcript_11967/g.28641 Transcript_11967/m.28641 type:complete len:193 (+) Transcript_11967:327-905(+)
MGFRRSFPRNPSDVNTSPKGASVAKPRSTIRQRIVDPFDDDDDAALEQHPQQFVYELNHRGRTQSYKSSNIKPSVDRARYYPGRDANRPDLDSFWSYLYHCVVDPCCGDLEQVYGRHRDSTLGLFEEEMTFFNAAEGEYSLGPENMDLSMESYLDEDFDDNQSFASRTKSFMSSRGRSFRNMFALSESMAEI